MKKILCFIMSIIIALSFSISASAEVIDSTESLTATGLYSKDDLSYGNFNYHYLDDKTVEISYYLFW